MPQLVTCNDAVAMAAVAAGVNLVAHYPGSPVNGVEPAIRKLAREHALDIRFNDSLNEHVAALAAAGASFSGARSLLIMKHVGLNIAADPLNYVGYTGVRGGMVIVVGTDPGATCSTGEEDVHWFAPQFNYPLFEPASVADAYRCVHDGFELSEQFEVPVLVFLPTALCWSSAFLESFDLPPDRDDHFRFEKNADRYINVGARAVNNHRRLNDRIDSLAMVRQGSVTHFGENAPIGIVARGATCDPVIEAVNTLQLHDRVQVLTVERVYPLHREEMLAFFANKQEVVVVEDQDGFLEHMTKSLLFNDVSCTVRGKDLFPRHGRIEFAQVEDFLRTRFNLPPRRASLPIASDIPERLGTFCEGCPHRGAFWGIDRALSGRDAVIGGDIGCSSLPPFRADWLMCMNAGIGIAQGICEVSSSQTIVSTGGEGSFFHGGLLSLISAVHNNLALVHVVLDNRAVAMTGGQASPTTTPGVDVPMLLQSIGVADFTEVSAFRPTAVSKAISAALERPGVRVIWVTGNCALTPDAEHARRRASRTLDIENERCGSCSACYTELQCPAILRSSADGTLRIDLERCMRCGECLDICPNDAIRVTEKEGAFNASS
jgi:indolepyruvate ferredoxin oxidoreductase alpha subunit